MKKIFCGLFLGLFIVLSACPSQAITLGFDPLAQGVTTGSTFSVNLKISGLGEGAAPSLGAYDLDILFDPSILAFDDVVFGNQLDILGIGSVSGSTISGPGDVNIFEISLDDPAILDAFQAGSFTLATFTFNALAVGFSPLNISINDLGDSLGDSLLADTIMNGSATVSAAAVPEPATLFLLGSGLIGLIGFREKFKN